MALCASWPPDRHRSQVLIKQAALTIITGNRKAADILNKEMSYTSSLTILDRQASELDFIASEDFRLHPY